MLSTCLPLVNLGLFFLLDVCNYLLLVILFWKLAGKVPFIRSGQFVLSELEPIVDFAYSKVSP